MRVTNIFRFTIPFLDPGDYLHTCLSSILIQSNRNWTAHLYDDLSTDHSPEIARRYCEIDSRFRLTTNTEQNCHSQILYRFAREPEFRESDIGVQVDSDDWLADADVLSRLDRAYSEHPALLTTFGNFVRFQGGQRTTVGFASEPESYERIRQLPWTATHLKTHRIGLLKRVRLDSLLDDDGSWLRNAADLASSFPMLEMAGAAHSRCLESINLVYNMDNPRSETRTRRAPQARSGALSRGRPPYAPLTEAEVRSIVSPPG